MSRVTSSSATGASVISGSVTVVQPSGANLHVDVDNFPVTQSVTQGTIPWSDNIAFFGGTAVSLGQKVSASSMPVVIASDQSAIPVTGTVTAIQATGANLHVNVDNFPATQPVSGTVTALQGTSPWVVSGSGNFTVVQPTGSSLHVDVDNFPATQSVTQGTTPWSDNIAFYGGTATSLGQKASASSIPVVIASDQSAIPTTATISGSVTVVQPSGANLHVNVDNFPATVAVTQSTTPWSDNISQYGGVATSLGQKVSASSIPVVLASDQSAVNVTATGTVVVSSVTSGPFPSSSTSTVTSVSSSATNVTLLSSNAARRAAYFYNDSTQVAYVKLGTTASTSSYTLQMAPLSFATIDLDPVYTGRVDALWAAANGNMRVTELT